MEDQSGITSDDQASDAGGPMVPPTPPTPSGGESKDGLGSKARTALKNLDKWWEEKGWPGVVKFAALVAAFYKRRIHPILGMRIAPESRAIFAARMLCRLALVYGILSIIGATIMMFITTEGDCAVRSPFTDTCWEYETNRPFLVWAIVSLFGALILASLLYSIGSYIEARMLRQRDRSN